MYRPDATELRAVDADAALRRLKELLVGGGGIKWYAVAHRRGDTARDFDVTNDTFRFNAGSRYQGPKAFNFADLAEIEIVEKAYPFHKEHHVRLSADHFLGYALSQDGLREQMNRSLADALFVLRREALGEGQDEQFQAALSEYQAANPKPAFPEQARRSRVQAEFAVEQRRFNDAVRFYGEALKVAPWWPEGRFNLALVLAEAKRYPQAIVQMKRFLALEPQHPQARAAQDQIYRWESVAGPGAAPAAAQQTKGEPCRSVFGCAQQELRR